MMGGGDAASTTKRNEIKPCFLAMSKKEEDKHTKLHYTIEHNMLTLINFVIFNKD